MSARESEAYRRTFVVRDRSGKLVRREFAGPSRERVLALTFEWEEEERRIRAALTRTDR